MNETQIPLPERGYFPGAGMPTASPLRALLALIAGAPSVESLKTEWIPAVAAYFGARRAAMMLFGEAPWREMPPEVRDNPVVRALLERHAPVHEALIVAPGDWSALCPWSDHGHVLCGPIVREGELIGSLALTRQRGEAAFDAANLSDASALCLHLSTWFGRRQTNGEAVLPRLSPRLSPRERQISELVAQGLTNAQIGARLCVSGETVKAALKGVFRKLEIHSRAQLVARALQFPAP